MNCPKCDHRYMKRLNTRLFKTFNSRIVQCRKCGFLWTSKEYLDVEFNHPGYNKRIEGQFVLFEEEEIANIKSNIEKNASQGKAISKKQGSQ